MKVGTVFNGLNAASMFEFHDLESAARDRVILDLLKRADDGVLSRADAGVTRWQNGWQENLDDLRAGIANPLKPKYFRPGSIMRFNGQFVQPVNPNIENDWYEGFTNDIFVRWLSGFGTIYEFGCGSGLNISKLATMFPASKIVGLDWAKASVDICSELNKRGLNVHGRLFDFFGFDSSVPLDSDSAVLTIGAIEQSGKKWEPLLDYWRAQKARRVVHIEPILEWYEPDSLVDYTAIRIHKARNYLEGYWPRLKELEREGRLKIVHAHRTGFGSLTIEGYSQIVWEMA
jgi:hypothetical protein